MFFKKIRHRFKTAMIKVDLQEIMFSKDSTTDEKIEASDIYQDLDQVSWANFIYEKWDYQPPNGVMPLSKEDKFSFHIFKNLLDCNTDQTVLTAMHLFKKAISNIQDGYGHFIEEHSFYLKSYYPALALLIKNGAYPFINYFYELGLLIRKLNFSPQLIADFANLFANHFENLYTFKNLRECISSLEKNEPAGYVIGIDNTKFRMIRNTYSNLSYYLSMKHAVLLAAKPPNSSTPINQNDYQLPLPSTSSQYQLYESEKHLDEDFKELVRGYDLFEIYYNREGNGLLNSFKFERIDDFKVIIDEKTGLMWEQAGHVLPYYPMPTKESLSEILANLNAGDYSNWRLPTVLEAMSLLSPLGNRNLKNAMFIDQVFHELPEVILTSDEAKEGFPYPICVNYKMGCVGSFYWHEKNPLWPKNKTFKLGLRAVRSIN